MSQERLGEAIGLTFQQVQKYERGANRIGASRLWDLSHVLDVPMGYFFEEMDDTTSALSPRNLTGGNGSLHTLHEGADPDPLARRETLELVRSYYRIADPQVRRRVFDLTRTLGVGDTGESG
ncbi:transcriptional regulator with XRE-family HTH domain [Roseospira marina]|nr:transcriptional regulator with XRE-family HTH domain [Roseospira marina]MBB5088043.1 transcriptional regulator with XRE-family HTH domain [Roseospira marina]